MSMWDGSIVCTFIILESTPPKHENQKLQRQINDGRFQQLASRDSRAKENLPIGVMRRPDPGMAIAEYSRMPPPFAPADLRPTMNRPTAGTNVGAPRKLAALFPGNMRKPARS